MSELRRLNRERQQALEELPPEAETSFAAPREQLRQRNEPNSAPVPPPATVDNPALRL
jgi:hypothetical protein